MRSHCKLFHRLRGSFLSDGACSYFAGLVQKQELDIDWKRGRRQQQSRECLKRIPRRPTDTNTGHHFTLSDTLDGNVSQGHGVICYKWPCWARTEILGRSNAAVSEMIRRTSTTDLAGSCANANCPNNSFGKVVDILAVTSEVALFLAQWVVWPICTVWQDGVPKGPEELRFWVIVLFFKTPQERNQFNRWEHKSEISVWDSQSKLKHVFNGES